MPALIHAAGISLNPSTVYTQNKCGSSSSNAFKRLQFTLRISVAVALPGYPRFSDCYASHASTHLVERYGLSVVSLPEIVTPVSVVVPAYTLQLNEIQTFRRKICKKRSKNSDVKVLYRIQTSARKNSWKHSHVNDTCSN